MKEVLRRFVRVDPLVVAIRPFAPKPEGPLYRTHPCVARCNPRKLLELGSAQRAATEEAEKIEQHLATVSIHHWSLAAGAWVNRAKVCGKCIICQHSDEGRCSYRRR